MRLGYFEENLQNYINEQKEILDKLLNFEPPDFKQLSFDTHEITEVNHRVWLKTLQSFGVHRKISVLYYFELVGSIKQSEIQKIIKNYKASPGKKNIALPRVNEFALDCNSNILYVGKTNSNFLTRFSQHIGFGSHKTYALHLNSWVDMENLHLILNYAVYDIKKDNLYLLEHLESSLHSILNPLLGRSGH